MIARGRTPAATGDNGDDVVGLVAILGLLSFIHLKSHSHQRTTRGPGPFDTKTSALSLTGQISVYLVFALTALVRQTDGEFGMIKLPGFCLNYNCTSARQSHVS